MPRSLHTLVRGCLRTSQGNQTMVCSHGGRPPHREERGLAVHLRRELCQVLVPESEWGLAPTKVPSDLRSGPAPPPPRGAQCGAPPCLAEIPVPPGALWLDQRLPLRPCFPRRERCPCSWTEGVGQRPLESWGWCVPHAQTAVPGRPHGLGGPWTWAATALAEPKQLPAHVPMSPCSPSCRPDASLREPLTLSRPSPA